MRAYGRRPIEERFFAKVEFTDTCWLWTSTTNNGGYGRFWIDDDLTVMAHRWSYEYLVGKIPDSLQIDHLCRVHNCVSPWHLEPVTCLVNLMRGETVNVTKGRATQCVQGHAYPVEAYRYPSTGRRRCAECHRIAERKRYAARKAAA